MSNAKIALYVEMLEKAKNDTLRVAGSVPEGSRLRQLAPGKATPLWLVGHLTNTMNTVVIRWVVLGESLVDREFGKQFAPDFAGGTPPGTDAAQYPAWDEVLARYDAVMTAAIAALATLDDSVLPEPLPGRVPDPLRQFFSSVGVTLNQMVAHDAYHRGQMAMIGALPL